MNHNAFFKRWIWELIASALLLGLMVMYYGQNKPNDDEIVNKFQSTFTEKSEKVDRILQYEKHRLTHFGLQDVWQRKVDDNIYLHIYRNDSLIFWNSNQLPVLRFAEIHFPAQGVVHLQNGWYYTRHIDVDSITICATFLIKKEYAHQNKELENGFAPSFGFSRKATIELIDGENRIVDSAGNFLFRLEIDNSIQISESTNQLLGVWITLILLVCAKIFAKNFERRPNLLHALLPLPLLLLFRQTLMNSLWSQLPIFDPSLFALNVAVTHLFDFILMIWGIGWLFFIARQWLVRHLAKSFTPILHAFVLIAFFPLWSIFMRILQTFIENSEFSMRVTEIFKLNSYSIIGFILFGGLFLAYFRLVLLAYFFLIDRVVSRARYYSLLFVVSIIYLIVELFWGIEMFIPALFPGWILLLVGLLESDHNHKTKMAGGILYLAAFSIAFSNLLNTVNNQKEHSLRELYANRLLSDRDIETEIELSNLGEKIQKDEYLKRVILQPPTVSTSDFQDAIDRRLFSGFWDQYEIAVYLFNPDNSLYFGPNGATWETFLQIKQNHAQLSEVSAKAWYVLDYIQQYAYLYQDTLEKGTPHQKTLLLTLKSKRIPEEIGFPRLLIPEKTQVFESLEEYAIAKYYNGKLVAAYGAYQYPVLLSAFHIEPQQTDGYLMRGNFEHYFLKGMGENYIILSRESGEWTDVLTSFSYLFCLFGLILLPGMWIRRSAPDSWVPATLSAKIPLVVIALLFVSLLVYGWGSGVFVRNQYKDYNEKIISEKLNSVYQEFDSKYGDSLQKAYQMLSPIESSLQKYSKIFVTDINLYDVHGYMIASSRPKIYNIGLLSEQMNPDAMAAMTARNESQFVHKEQIGNLVYSSAYQPVLNENGEALGFLNLQHFGQQEGFEIQLQRFLTSIVNVFMFLLTISAVVSILVTTWLTHPLRVLQEKLAAVDFSKLNEPIEYSRADEVGALVKEYNKKIDELAITAQQLAKSERESAWREMAKQVAHEIKNPLTPIKLSLQHFQRVYDAREPMSNEKINLLVHSLIEQIDGLSTIANDFANFAKMPTPSHEQLDLVHIIRSVASLFEQSEDNPIHLDLPEHPVYLNGDKDMMVRIMNNLLKNAIQASSPRQPIAIRLSRKEKEIEIEVSDQGIGIAEDLQDKLFVPYFTTKSTGTGLGLAMVKQMVELHKGQISVESKPGEGATFVVRFPAD